MLCTAVLRVTVGSWGDVCAFDSETQVKVFDSDTLSSDLLGEREVDLNLQVPLSLARPPARSLSLLITLSTRTKGRGT